ncbi:MAG: component of SufBCD complex [Phaeovulum sp.]|nr:component of SufBCD complex [Phaeovulum sp.]MDP3861920.1 component of SufBCD complex [Phaeovulum sp.]
MDMLQTLTDLIDMRSFSNLWYWIALAVTWSSASRWVIGVPWDMVIRARRRGGVAAEQLHTLMRLNVARYLLVAREGGLAATALGSFLMTVVLLLGFAYQVEFCQALSFIAVPMTLVAWLSLRVAQHYEAALTDGVPSTEVLIHVLSRHRLHVQLVGIVALTITAFWGMVQNLNISILN